MPTMGEIIRELREQHELRQDQVAEMLGIAQSVYSRKERGVVRVTALERKKLAKIFGMTLDEFDAKWRRSMTEDVPRTRGGPGIPVINRAPAGQIVDYEEYGYDSGQGMSYIDFGRVQDDLAFAVEVVGDSMQTALNPGDILVLSWCDPYKKRPHVEQPADGKVVFVRFTEESGRSGCTLARMYIENDGQKIRLAKDNVKYPAIVVDREDIAQLAVAIEYRRKM